MVKSIIIMCLLYDTNIINKNLTYEKFPTTDMYHPDLCASVGLLYKLNLCNYCKKTAFSHKSVYA